MYAVREWRKQSFVLNSIITSTEAITPVVLWRVTKIQDPLKGRVTTKDVRQYKISDKLYYLFSIQVLLLYQGVGGLCKCIVFTRGRHKLTMPLEGESCVNTDYHAIKLC